MKGIQTLEKLCAGKVLYEMDFINRAVEELKPQGANASRALAKLIGELLDCRSPKLELILTVAEQLEPTPELIEAVRSVSSAPSLAPQPTRSRFWPEIVGGGRVGWTDGTANRIKRNAAQALEKLTEAKSAEEGKPGTRPTSDRATAPVAPETLRPVSESWKPRSKMGWVLTAVSGLPILLGSLCCLSFVVAQLSNPAGVTDDLGGFIAALILCPLPVLTIGLALLLIGVFILRSPQKRPVAAPSDSRPESPRKRPAKKRGGPSLSMLWLNICIRQHNVPGMLDALQHENSAIREGAAQALGQYREVSAVQPLIQALKDEDRDVRRHAAYALENIGDPRAIGPLIQALNDKDWTVRGGAAYALGSMGDPKAVEPLIQALKDEEVETLFDVAKALGKIGDARAAEPLVQALNHRDEEVQVRAALALGTMGDARAVETLIPALKHRHSIVRREAAETLGNTGGARAVEPLVQALKDKDLLVRWRAARALGAIGDARAVEPLTQVLEGNPHRDVREAAEESLAKIKASSPTKIPTPNMEQS